MIQRVAVQKAGVGTAIFDFSVDPTFVATGNYVIARGKLAAFFGPVVNPIANETVELLVDGNVATSGLTSSGGLFTFNWQASALGQHTVQVRYNGSWAYDSCQSASIVVEVVKPGEEWKGYIKYLPYVALAGVAGILGYLVWRWMSSK